MVHHLWKLISTFHKNHLDKLTSTSLFIDSVPPIAKCSASPNVNNKQKRSRLINSVQKKAKYQPTGYQLVKESRISFLFIMSHFC